MKKLPDKLQLDIMWSVATSSAIETRQKPHLIFAKLLYDELNDIKLPVELGVGIHGLTPEEKVSETAQERGERVHNEIEETIKIHDGYGVVDYQPTPQTPEQVADGLKEAFREAVKQGVVSSTTKPQTLTDLIYDWWEDVFTTHSDWDMETSIENLVDEISLWLPTEHDTNSYKWNQCIRMIREKLR